MGSAEVWRRHANPWSVWTRFAAIPAMAAAVWSRTSLGWWAAAPVALVVLWLVLNPFAFAPVTQPTAWSSRGIFGEQLWLHGAVTLSAGSRRMLRLLVVVGFAGMVVFVYGLVRLEPWPTAHGMTVIVMAQLWRIDRFAAIYDRTSGPAADGEFPR